MNDSSMNFNPDYEQEHPGEYLAEVLESRGIKKVDFAERCGRSAKTISEIITGKTVITPETALQFERVLGIEGTIWLQLDANYQLQQARKRDLHSFESESDWVEKFPTKIMVQKGFDLAKPTSDNAVDSLLRFFGVSSISAWENFCRQRVANAQFKQVQSSPIDEFSVAAWIRQTELEAIRSSTSRYDESKFRSALPSIRLLTMIQWPHFKDELIQICADAGVSVVMVPSLSKTGLRGAAYWLSKDKPVIALSDRLGYAEKFWFAFFHEACHILFHSKKIMFLEPDSKQSSGNELEDEADEFSAETLIPSSFIKLAIDKYGRKSKRFTAKSIESIASQLDISPGLLLERLQHEGIATYKTKLNSSLKQKLRFD